MFDFHTKNFKALPKVLRKGDLVFLTVSFNTKMLTTKNVSAIVDQLQPTLRTTLMSMHRDAVAVMKQYKAISPGSYQKKLLLTDKKYLLGEVATGRIRILIKASPRRIAYLSKSLAKFGSIVDDFQYSHDEVMEFFYRGLVTRPNRFDLVASGLIPDYVDKVNKGRCNPGCCGTAFLPHMTYWGACGRPPIVEEKNMAKMWKAIENILRTDKDIDHPSDEGNNESEKSK